MSPAIVDRVAWGRKVGISECPNGHADTLNLTFLSMEEICPADWTETEPKFSALITAAHVFRSLAEHFVWSRKARECREDAACSLLAGKAMADTDNSGLAVDFNAKLAAVT